MYLYAHVPQFHSLSYFLRFGEFSYHLEEKKKQIFFQYYL